MTGAKSISDVLSETGLISFIGAFMAEDVCSVDDLKMLSDADMKEIGLNIGQRNRLKRHLGIGSTGMESFGSSSTASTASFSSFSSNSSSSLFGSSFNNHNDGPTAAERQKYLALFRAIDKDGNGDVDLDEWIMALKKMDLYKSDWDARRIFNQADADGGGTLDENEFVNLMHTTSQQGGALSAMAQAGQEVLDKLKSNTKISMTIEDILQAPVTDEALDKVRQADNSNTYIPHATDCNQTKCNFIFNILLVDLELVKDLCGHVCRSMLEDLEKTLSEVGLSGFSHRVNFEAVKMDAVRKFVDLIHYYSHTTDMNEDNITKPQLDFLHSYRKAALVVAADKSVQDVRDGARSLLYQMASESQSSSRRGALNSFARDVGVGVATDTGAELALMALEGGCNIM